MIKNLKIKLDKIGVASAVALTTTVATCVPVFAAEGDSSAITGAVTSGIANTKTEFLAILGVAVAGAMGFFAVKYAVNQGIGFFAKISKKG